MSVYELSRKIKRNPSTVHSAIQRLANGNEIVTKTIVRKKGIVKRVYPRNFEFPDSHVITIPKNAIHVENPTWQNAYVYQLNSERNSSLRAQKLKDRFEGASHAEAF